jgi:hypothetical protein
MDSTNFRKPNKIGELDCNFLPIYLPCIGGAMLAINSIMALHSDMRQNYGIEFLITSRNSTDHTAMKL